MTPRQMANITILTANLKEAGLRYLAEVGEDGTYLIRVFEGLDES